MESQSTSKEQLKSSLNEHSHKRLDERFKFSSEALDKDTFLVIRFKGNEGINILYSFEISLMSQSSDISLQSLFMHPATFTILREDGKHAHFKGYPSSCAQGAHINGWTFYTLTLQPQFWKLTCVPCNRINLKLNTQGLIDTSMSDDSTFKPSYKFKLLSSYQSQDFSMQHNETMYDYIAAKAERDGIYYFFKHTKRGEVVYFVDSKLCHESLEHSKIFIYSPTTGMEYAHREEVISSFVETCTALPRTVFLRDYNWQKPNTPVTAQAEVSDMGLGEVYYYGEGFTTTAEGERLAKIRAEELICHSHIYVGTSQAPTLSPGFLFTLKKHYAKSFNKEYLVTEVTHSGSQEGYLSLVLGIGLEHPSDKVFYHNDFKAISSDVQFRPKRVTIRPKVSGFLTAFIDASSNSKKPELDNLGRYKVIFPQETTGKGKGKGSCWLRRAQPSVGAGIGTSFPLSPGVEVLLTFLDGDPDRPLIASAVCNVETGATDTGASALSTGIRAGGGGGIMFGDGDSKQGFNLQTGSNRSGMLMSSGSLDSAYNFSDTSLEWVDTLGGSYCGLANDLQGGFQANLIATGLDVLSGLVKPIIDTASNLVTSSFKLDKAVKMVDADDYPPCTVCKNAHVEEKVVDKIDDKGKPVMKDKLDAKGEKIVALDEKGKKRTDAEGKTVYEQEPVKEKAAGKETIPCDGGTACGKYEDALEAQTPEKNYQICGGFEDLTKMANMIISIIGECTREKLNGAIYSTSISGSAGEKNADEGGQVRLFKSLTTKDKTALTALEVARLVTQALDSAADMTSDIKSVPKEGSEKAQVAVTAVLDGAEKLLPEILSLFTIFSSKFNVNKTTSDLAGGTGFGGVRIISDKGNVAIGSETETRVTADKSLVFYGGDPLNKSVIDSTAPDFAPAVAAVADVCAVGTPKVTIKTRAPNLLVAEANQFMPNQGVLLYGTHISSVGAGRHDMSSFGNATLRATDTLTISNDYTLLKKMHVKGFERADLNLENATTIEMNRAKGLTICNAKGNTLLMQQSKDNDVDYLKIQRGEIKTTNITLEGDTLSQPIVAPINELLFDKDSSTLSFKGKVKNNIVLSNNSIMLGVDTANSVCSLVLMPKKFAVTVEKTEAITVTDKAVNLDATASAGGTITLSAAGNVVINAAETKIAKSSFKDDGITLKAGMTVKISSNMITIE